MESEIILYAGLFLILLGLSAFFSGAETAYFSLSKSELERFKNSTVPSERRISSLLATPHKLLITTVVGNTAVNIVLASLAAIQTANFAGKVQISVGLALLLEMMVVTLVLLATSEILPRMIAVRNPYSYARIASIPLQILFHLIYPVTGLLTHLAKIAQKTVGLSIDKALLSEEALKSLVLLGQDEGRLQEEEKEMIHSIFEFGETTVKEIMVPRTDMVCVEVNSTLPEIMEVLKNKLLSRIPVYEGRIDNIVGILYVKDLLPLLSKGKNVQINLRELVRKPYFVPEQKMIDDLLRHFQQKRQHMALVVDEYGGISGLVTLEDVIEEIVGDIQDEYDEEEPLITRLDDHTFVVDGRVNIEEINDELDLNLPTEEGVETISGFILNLLGALPQEKETTRYNGHQFVVEEIDKNRILKVRIEKNLSNENVEPAPEE